MIKLPANLSASKIYFADKSSLLEHAEKFEQKLKAIDTKDAPQGSLAEYEVLKANQVVKWRLDLNGIVRYPVQGVLTMDEDLFYWHYDYSTPYSFIESDFKEFKDNPNVKGVLLEIHSGGGEAVGYTDSLNSIINLGKPVVAHSRAWTMSMAYMLACCSDALYASSSSRVGSIGTIYSQWNISKALDKAGIESVVLRYGDDKQKPREDEEVNAENYARMADWVKKDGEEFVSFVAEKRNLTTTRDENGQIPWAEGRHFSAEEAEKLGLIDGIASSDESYKHLLSLIDTGQKPESSAARNSQNTVQNMKIEEQLKAAEDENASLKASLQEKESEIASLKGSLEAKEKAEKENLIAQINEIKPLTASENKIYQKCSTEELKAVFSEFKAAKPVKAEEPKAEGGTATAEPPTKTEPPKAVETQKIFVGAIKAEEDKKEEPILGSGFHSNF
jgi:signal peptide peptidase SppA